LGEKFRFCKIGYNQSPINIENGFAESDLSFSYQPSVVGKEKKNHVVNINFGDEIFLLQSKKKYFLRSISFHHPSEHLVKGEASSLEMQLYHKSENEQRLALAIFLEVGKENPAFDELINFLTSDKKEGKIDVSRIVKESDKIFFYDGSLTTPPCTEGVKWYVMKTPIQLSKEQMNKIIKSAILAKSNARPTQEFHSEKY